VPEGWEVSEAQKGRLLMARSPGLWANIHAKRKAGKKMRRKGAKGAPTDAAMRRAAKTSKPKRT